MDSGFATFVAPRNDDVEGAVTSRMTFARKSAHTIPLAVVSFLLVSFLLAGVATASALDYPSRPVRWIVGYPAGGAADIVARIMGQWLMERLGQSVIIENKSGASTNIATQAVISAPPRRLHAAVGVARQRHQCDAL